MEYFQTWKRPFYNSLVVPCGATWFWYPHTGPVGQRRYLEEGRRESIKATLKVFSSSNFAVEQDPCLKLKKHRDLQFKFQMNFLIISFFHFSLLIFGQIWITLQTNLIHYQCYSQVKPTRPTRQTCFSSQEATMTSPQPRSSLQPQTAPLPPCQPTSGISTRPSSRLETSLWSPPVED